MFPCILAVLRGGGGRVLLCQSVSYFITSPCRSLYITVIHCLYLYAYMPCHPIPSHPILCIMKCRSLPTAAADSSITGPMSLKSYYAVATYNDPKTKFSFAEGAVVQVLQKDPTGEQSVFSSHDCCTVLHRRLVVGSVVPLIPNVWC